MKNLIFILISFISFSMVSMSKNKSKLDELSEITGMKANSHLLTTKEGTLHYISIGDKSKPILLLIHGSPGSWDAWFDVISKTDLLKKYFILAIDRPHYNKTEVEEYISLQQQSEMIGVLFEKYPNPITIMGHSYGGALALQAGIDYQNKTKGVISIAGTLAAPYQKAKWYNKVGHFPLVRWFLPKKWLASNYEMRSLSNDLTELEKTLPQYTKKISIVQGDKDVLVNPKTPDYIHPKLSAATVQVVKIPKENHFIIWSNLEAVTNAIDWISTP